MGYEMGTRTIQLWVIVHDRIDPDHDPVVHRPHPVPRPRVPMSPTSSSHSITPNRPTNTHQCVLTKLSLPLRANIAPPRPAIFASRDCANVSVTNGREGSVWVGVGVAWGWCSWSGS